MQQLRVHEASQQQPWDPPSPPPPLLVMGEEARHVEKQPHGYAFQDDSAISRSNGPLVTTDRVWQYEGSMLLTSRAQVKDICLSFALFKLLRCGFARYKVSKVGTMGTLSFLWSLFLKDAEHVRIFQLVADELSFLDDYYYSSLPISFSKWWLPILSISISLSSISYCVVTVSVLILQWAQRDALSTEHMYGSLFPFGQMYCSYWCSDMHLTNAGTLRFFGFVLIDVVAASLLIALVMIAEVQTDEALGRKNWPVLGPGASAKKNNPVCSSDASPPLSRKDEAGQGTRGCEGLHHPCMRSSRNGGLSQGTSSLRQSQAGERLLWACSGKGTSDTILAWHIATCILEVRYPSQQAGREQGSPSNLDSDHKIAATHLSRYCAYLMIWLPELLPDDDAWSKGLYEAVKKDADRVLAGRTAVEYSSSTPEAECQKLVELLLGEGSEHEVLKNGVKLGKQLVELAEGEEETWKLLAGFWSEMILYVAPSDNLKGHSEAIARGGEFITLFHAGIFSRPDEADGAASASAGV